MREGACLAMIWEVRKVKGLSRSDSSGRMALAIWM